MGNCCATDHEPSPAIAPRTAPLPPPGADGGGPFPPAPSAPRSFAASAPSQPSFASVASASPLQCSDLVSCATCQWDGSDSDEASVRIVSTGCISHGDDEASSDPGLSSSDVERSPALRGWCGAGPAAPLRRGGAGRSALRALRAAALPTRGGGPDRPAAKVLRPWAADMLGPDGAAHLATGGVLFGFSCTAARGLSGAERRLLGVLTCTAAPRPPPDFSPPARRGGVVILTRAAYVLPGMDLSALSAPMIASVDYQRITASSSMRITAPRGGQPNSFCLTKIIIPVVWSVTVEYRATEVPVAALPPLSAAADGARVDRAFVLDDCGPGAGGEYLRTVLLYHDLGGGVVCWCITIVARGPLPGAVVRVVDKVGVSTADEVSEIVGKARRHWASSYANDRAHAYAHERAFTSPAQR